MDYEDLFEMFDAILAYVKEHPGCEILSADDPMARRIGFTTRALKETIQSKFWHRPWVKWGFLGRWFPSLKPKREEVEVWEIGLVKIRASINKEGVTDETRAILRKTFVNPLGRSIMAQALTRGQSPVASA